MGMSINTNLSALNTYRNLNATQNDLSKSLEKLSSGLRINRAADDAAGLSISEGLKSQVGGLTVAARNAQDGISVVQTAEGGLTETHSILQRMRDLAVQAGNDSNNDTSRAAIKTESDQLQKELGRIASSTNFNGTSLLNSNATLKFQVGANAGTDSQIAVDLSGANVQNIVDNLNGGSTGTGTKFVIADVAALAGAATFEVTKGGETTSVTTGNLGAAGSFDSVQEYADALKADTAFAANFTVTVDKDANGAGTGITVTANNGGAVAVAAPGTGVAAGTAGAPVTGGVAFDTADKAQASIKLIDEQIAKVSSARSNLGAIQNRFDHAINVTNVAKENLTAAKSRITDVDMAEEMVKYTRDNILSQAGTSMLAQANQSTQGVLSLLR
ncbi:flagellin [Curtobacterium sp. MCJR17_055]|uniref:flagellin N-terminal helical domain-containing protein n=1 Tax=unclassified Curtobacterium TaxID=257496 RepID=UPI000D8A187C|nr:MULTISPECIES: flagellin [unclassified Curtobacterium]PYY33119.1 flagellin [Curtobacterium sp. MCBD17_029]PYY53824.1 flagellin [Curtobacterium sp. MCJR17_055]PYY59287.1 flagellin [Curtobacterium sp. MCPF17_015]PZE92773.1 flagellin [Curtobacterium sp. MCBD17_008]WIB34912.1 flagellin [Curtobacterium sp. MCJR17_043]